MKLRTQFPDRSLQLLPDGHGQVFGGNVPVLHDLFCAVGADIGILARGAEALATKYKS